MKSTTIKVPDFSLLTTDVFATLEVTYYPARCLDDEASFTIRQRDVDPTGEVFDESIILSEFQAKQLIATLRHMMGGDD